MKKIKFFFFRNYRRLIRLATALASSLLIVFGALSVYAYDGQPDVKLSSIDYGVVNFGVPYVETRSNSKYCGYASTFAPYIYEVMSGSTQGTTYPTPYYSYNACASLSSLYEVNGSKMFAPNSYSVCQTISFSKRVTRASFYVKLGSGFVFDTDSVQVQNMGNESNFTSWNAGWQAWNASYEFCVYNCEAFKLKTFVKNTSVIATLGISVSLNTVYFEDGTSLIIDNNNQNTDKIVSAIEGNKSSAENNEYSGTTSEQKKAQSDLDTSEKKISEDTAEARTTTINIFKNFTVPGDIMKGLLTVTNLFNSLCANIPFAPIILNFSLAIGAAAFLLGLAAVIIRRSRQ